MIRHAVGHVLRRLHLLYFADQLMFSGSLVKTWKANRMFRAAHSDFVPPPLQLAYDAYNHTNWQDYFDTGLSHAALITQLIREYFPEGVLTICEWGCGPARVIRHLANTPALSGCDLIGTDYNDEAIAWCARSINGIRFERNGLQPPLPLPSEHCDCVYAISIFTHLSERMHYAWVTELFRILKPGGILIFTTHGDRSADRLLPAEKARYDSGHFVVRARYTEGKKYYLAYQSPQFVERCLLKDRVVLRHIQNPSRYLLEQDVWVARRSDDASAVAYATVGR